MVAGFFPPSLGPIPTYLIIWGLFFTDSTSPDPTEIFGKVSLTHLGIDDSFYDSGMGPRQCGHLAIF